MPAAYTFERGSAIEAQRGPSAAARSPTAPSLRPWDGRGRTRQSGRLAEHRFTVEVRRPFDLLRSLYSVCFPPVKAGCVLSSSSIDPCLGAEGVRLSFTRTQRILSALFSTTYFSNFSFHFYIQIIDFET